MTPAQLLQRIEPSVSASAEPDMLPPASYTSETMEEDFSTSVELLMGTPRFLDFLRDADDHYHILGEKARTELNEHLDTIQEFTGQWLND